MEVSDVALAGRPDNHVPPVVEEVHAASQPLPLDEPAGEEVRSETDAHVALLRGGARPFIPGEGAVSGDPVRTGYPPHVRAVHHSPPPRGGAVVRAAGKQAGGEGGEGGGHLGGAAHPGGDHAPALGEHGEGQQPALPLSPSSPVVHQSVLPHLGHVEVPSRAAELSPLRRVEEAVPLRRPQAKVDHHVLHCGGREVAHVVASASGTALAKQRPGGRGPRASGLGLASNI